MSYITSALGAPPNGRGPMIFYAQNAILSQYFHRSLRSRFILNIILNDFYFNLYKCEQVRSHTFYVHFLCSVCSSNISVI